MEVIAIKCPHCAARLEASPGADTVTCEYCGTSAHIRKRTRILQIPRKVAGAGDGLPVATQAISPLVVGALALIGVATAGAVVTMALRSRGASAPTAAATSGTADAAPPAHDAAPPPPPPPVWWGKRPVAVDVSGDGTPDMVGHCRHGDADDAILCAVDGSTGALLWATDPVNSATEVHKPGPTLTVAGQRLLAAAGRDVKAFDPSGARAWAVALPEIITHVCRGASDASVRVLLADKTAAELALATGERSAADPEPACEPLESDISRGSTPTREVFAWWDPSRRNRRLEGAHPGMWGETSIYRPATGVTIALGTKRPGTKHPMAASYRITGRGKKAREVLWTTVIPAGDPFLAYERAVEAEAADLNDDAVFIAYAEKEEWHNYHLVGLDTATGERRFDVKLPSTGGPVGITTTADRVYVSRFHRLHCYDATRGEALWTYPPER